MSATGLWSRHRATLLILGALLLAIAAAAWAGGGARTSEPLDPDNPGAAGAQAVARVLEDEGVEVEVVRGADELASLGPQDAARTTYVVTSTDSLGQSTFEGLVEQAGGSPIVLVEPGPGLVEAAGLSEPPEGEALGRGRVGACADARFDDLELEVDSALEYPGTGCFGGGGSEGSVLLQRGRATLFGAGQALTNDQVLRADNAAVVLRLLGGTERLVWYVPSLADLSGDEGLSAEALLPQWVSPGLYLGAITLIGLVLWRGRRLGPLASEPLPVVVRAVETTRSRGRLYRRAGDRAHAASALRGAARRRAVGRLRLGAEVDPAVVVRDVARRTGRSVEQVTALLAPDAPAPDSDTALISLATDLAALDREVRRT